MFCYIEEWKSMPALEVHLQCERFKALFGAMKVLGEIDYAKIIQASQEQDL
jgi:quinol monooxygenase YgiN